MPVKRHPVATTHPTQEDARLESIPIDDRVVQQLRASYEQVRGDGTRLAEVFYAKLFAAAPHLRAMFPPDLQAQSEKLMRALDAVVRNLENPRENAAMLAALGQRHAEYGAKPEHYEVVVRLLVESMGEVLSDPAAAALQEWRVALDLISRQMQGPKERGRRAFSPQPFLKQSDRCGLKARLPGSHTNEKRPGQGPSVRVAFE
jgi:hemoglobin-like flavoprotein